MLNGFGDPAGIDRLRQGWPRSAKEHMTEGRAEAAMSARVRVRGFAPWTPRAGSRKLLEQVIAVLHEYRERQKYPVHHRGGARCRTRRSSWRC